MIRLLMLVGMVSANLDFLDIGLEYSKTAEVYYWTRDITVQLVYDMPRQSVKNFTKPRCEFARNARIDLYRRFKRQFPRVTKFAVYQQKCDRFAADDTYLEDNPDHCFKCFHINSENNPFYLECVTLIEIRDSHCKQAATHTIVKRELSDTKDKYMLSQVAVSLAKSAKTQDDRLTTKFRQEHQLHKEGVNFQLLFLNTFRWQMSMSDALFLQYVESDIKQFARVLVNLSGVLPQTRALTERKINGSLADKWDVQSASRNDTHVSVNVTFTAFNPAYRAQLYRFRFLPMNFADLLFVVHTTETYALQCDEIVIELSAFEANRIEKNIFQKDSYCHQNLDVSHIQNCMKSVLNAESDAKSVCVKGMTRLKVVNLFYLTTDYKVWFPRSVQLSYSCLDQRSGFKSLLPNSLLYPACGCEYAANHSSIPRARTCSKLQKISSNFSLFSQIGQKPFFLGKIHNDSNTGAWPESAVNKLSRELVERTETVNNYFKKKLEEEASTSASAAWRFRFGLSTLWLALPILGLFVFVTYVWCRCKGSQGPFGGQQPVFVNYCTHENEGVALRHINGQPPHPRAVVSWSAGERQALNKKT